MEQAERSAEQSAEHSAEQHQAITEYEEYDEELSTELMAQHPQLKTKAYHWILNNAYSLSLLYWKVQVHCSRAAYPLKCDFIDFTVNMSKMVDLSLL